MKDDLIAKVYKLSTWVWTLWKWFKYQSRQTVQVSERWFNCQSTRTVQVSLNIVKNVLIARVDKLSGWVKDDLIAKAHELSMWVWTLWKWFNCQNRRTVRVSIRWFNCQSRRTVQVSLNIVKNDLIAKVGELSQWGTLKSEKYVP